MPQFTPVRTRAQSQPADMGQRVLNRLYPQAPSYGAQPGMAQAGAQQPKSPTGLPVYTPPAPQMQPQGQQNPTAQMSAPPAPNSPASQFQGLWQHPADPYAGMNPDDRSALGAYDHSLYTGPDYRGRHETNQMLEGEFARLHDRWRNEAPINYSAAAPVHDEFARGRAALEARLAAMGHSGGGGVMAGAESQYQGQENTAVGDLIRQLLEARRLEHRQDQSGFDEYQRALQMMGLQSNIARQNSPSFGQQLLGTLGGIAGDFAGGYASGMGGKKK